MTSDQDARWMRAALGLGARNLGRTWPNPSVGCMIVKEGRLIGQGVTAPGGRPHAEPQALAQAGAGAVGSTVYVTLEPCAHHGKTPPCAEALVQAKVGRVVIACCDPDPRTAGKGIDLLKSAGIEVDLGCLEAEARQANAGFLKVKEQGLPYVTLKLATTLDGKIATATGESKWITGPLARRHVHLQRSRYDAIMVGAGTVRQDDPSLTVRDLGIDTAPLPVIVSATGNVPMGGKLFNRADKVRPWICCTPKGQGLAGSTTITCNETRLGKVDLHDMLLRLAEEGLTRIYCEGGATLAANLLKDDLVDQLDLYAAGKVIGAEGTNAIGALKLDQLADAPTFQHLSALTLGDDAYTQWRLCAQRPQ